MGKEGRKKEKGECGLMKVLIREREAPLFFFYEVLLKGVWMWLTVGSENEGVERGARIIPEMEPSELKQKSG